MKKVFIMPVLVGLLSIGTLKSMELPTLNPEAETADLEANISNNQNEICIGCNGFLNEGETRNYPCGHSVHEVCYKDHILSLSNCLQCKGNKKNESGWFGWLLGSKAKAKEQTNADLARRTDNLEMTLNAIRINGSLNNQRILRQLARSNLLFEYHNTVTSDIQMQSYRLGALADRITVLEERVSETEKLKKQVQRMKNVTIAASVIAGISLGVSLYALYSKPVSMLQYIGNNKS